MIIIIKIIYTQRGRGALHRLRYSTMKTEVKNEKCLKKQGKPNFCMFR